MNVTTRPEGGLARVDERLAAAEAAIPDHLGAVLRRIGRIFFQVSALTGALILAGIAVSSPPMVVRGLIGAAIGYATARLAKFDKGEVAAGICGFSGTRGKRVGVPALTAPFVLATWLVLALGLLERWYLAELRYSDS